MAIIISPVRLATDIVSNARGVIEFVVVIVATFLAILDVCDTF